MDFLEIEGGHPLQGTIPISGSKNAALPMLAACLLSEEPIQIDRVANLKDINHMGLVLEHLGASVSRENGSLSINSAKVDRFDTPYDLMRKMRASTYVLGPLVARFGKAEVALPGGCALGARPIDYHLKGLELLGAEVARSHGAVTVSAPGGLKGAHITLNFPSVGATANLMMAAVLAKGTTVLDNVAQEPHIKALGQFLEHLGATIQGYGSHRIEIQGVDKLKGGRFTNIPDQIVAGTYIGAALITKSVLSLCPVIEEDMACITGRFEEMGARFVQEGDTMTVHPPAELKPLMIQTLPHPGFPTDMQPVATAVLSMAKGFSTISETVFESRFMYVPELARMGACLTLKGNQCMIQGVDKLEGTEVWPPDLRAGAALVVAALAAEGKSVLYGLEHLDRGYEGIDQNLKLAGAKIERKSREGDDS